MRSMEVEIEVEVEVAVYVRAASERAAAT